MLERVVEKRDHGHHHAKTYANPKEPPVVLPGVAGQGSSNGINRYDGLFGLDCWGSSRQLEHCPSPQIGESGLVVATLQHGRSRALHIADAADPIGAGH